MPGVGSREILRRLDAYPDLARLARITLFLSMLIALTVTPGQFPTSRTDLIETYLKTLFSPHEHKAGASANLNASTLRNMAEILAFERLERQEIGATEREVLARAKTSKLGAISGRDAELSISPRAMTVLLRNRFLEHAVDLFVDCLDGLLILVRR